MENYSASGLRMLHEAAALELVAAAACEEKQIS